MLRKWTFQSDCVKIQLVERAGGSIAFSTISSLRGRESSARGEGCAFMRVHGAVRRLAGTAKSSEKERGAFSPVGQTARGLTARAEGGIRCLHTVCFAKHRNANSWPSLWNSVGSYGRFLRRSSGGTGSEEKTLTRCTISCLVTCSFTRTRK